MSLAVRNIRKSYGEKPVLKGISFDIANGNIVGFLGPNGAGKSTMMKIITGYITDFEGTAEVCGIDVRRRPLEAKRQIGYLPENNPLYLDMYVREYLAFVARLYKTDNPLRRVEQAVEQVGLSAESRKKIGQLSKGYRQRVGLAQALIHNPQVLILDEPTTGLDPNQLAEIRSLIKSIGKEKTVMFSTHIMQEVKAVCDRVMIINHGELVSDNVQWGEQSLVFVLEVEETSVNPDIFKEIESVVNVLPKAAEWEIEATRDVRSDIFRLAMQHGLTVKTLKAKEQDMEELFRTLTK